MGNRVGAGESGATERFDGDVDQRHALGAQLDIATREPGDVVGFASTVAPGEFLFVGVEVVDAHHGLIDQAPVEALACVRGPDRHRARWRRGDEVVDGGHLAKDARRRDQAHRCGVAIDVEQHLAVVDDGVDVAVAHTQHAELSEEAHGVTESLALGVLAAIDGEMLVAADALFDAVEQFGGKHLLAGLFERGQHDREVDVPPAGHRATVGQAGAAMRAERGGPAQQTSRCPRHVEAIPELLAELVGEDLFPAPDEREGVSVLGGDEWRAQQDPGRPLELAELVRRQLGCDSGGCTQRPGAGRSAGVGGCGHGALTRTSQRCSDTEPLGARRRVSWSADRRRTTAWGVRIVVSNVAAGARAASA